MRDKRKGIEPIDTSDLPALTENQHAWLLEYLRNGGNAVAAYRHAYDVSTWNANSIGVEACRLRWNPKIVPWLTAMRSSGLQSAKLTHEQYIAEQIGLAQRAETAGNYGAAVKAWENVARVSGLLDTNVNIHVTRSETDIMAELTRLRRETAAMAHDKPESLH